MDKWVRGFGLTVLRVVVGIVFLMHGWQKFSQGFATVAKGMGLLGIPMPLAAAIVVTLTEFVGGSLLILGLLTRPAAVFLAINMTVAVLGVHARNGFFLPHGYEYALTLLAANVTLLLAGPGVLSLDSRFFRRWA